MRTRFLISLAVLISASACSKSPPASQFPDARTALQRMKQTYSCARGIQGEGKLDFLDKQGRVRGNVMLMVADPDRVRFDVISPFGINLATLTSDGRRFALFDMKNKVFLEGPPDPCNIARMTQIEMPAHALVQLMRGQAPLLVHQPAAPTIAWDGGGYYVVQIPSVHEAHQKIHLEPHPADFGLPYGQQRLRVRLVEVSQRQYVHYRAELSDHEASSTMKPREDPLGLDPPIAPSGPACSAEVPRRIHMMVPNPESDVMFRYESAGLNPPLPQGVFTQPFPGGVQRQRATCR